jgi:hypothetical protein
MAAKPVHVPDPKPDIAPAPPEPRGPAVTRILAVAAAVALVGLGTISYLRTPTPVAERTTPVPPPVVTVLPEPTPVEPVPPVPALPAAKVAQESQPIRVPPPAVVIPQPLPPGTPGPTIESDGSETTALVPLTGSTQGMVHYSLSRHRGVTVNLPLAQSELPTGLHSVGRDGLRYVWIRDRAEGGIQVRFLFSNPPPDERLVELEDDALKIRIRLHADVATEKTAEETVGDVAVSQP